MGEGTDQRVGASAVPGDDQPAGWHIGDRNGSETVR
jgi:hypothetical protein